MPDRAQHNPSHPITWAAIAALAAATGASAAHPQSHACALLLLIACALATIIGTSQTLPFQNVAWAALVIAVLGGLAHSIAALTGFVFGSFTFAAAAGPRIAGVLPWWTPIAWIACILSSRSMARMIALPWRGTSRFGFALIAMASSLSAALAWNFAGWAAGVLRLWTWTNSSTQFPLAFLAGWLVVSGLIVTCITPMLIRKKPGASPLDVASPAAWVALNVFFALQLVGRKEWPRAAATLALTITAVVFAIRGARRRDVQG